MRTADAAAVCGAARGAFRWQVLQPVRLAATGGGQLAAQNVTENRPSRPPLAVAMEWVAKITTVALEMILPAIAGGFLDRRLGTQHWALVGLVLGFVVGLWHLLQMTRVTNRRGKSSGEGTSGGSSDA